MKVLSFLGAVGLGIFSGAWIIALRRRSTARKSPININEASQEDIMQMLGLDSSIAEQIVEHRPYPTKLDLLGRMVITPDIYNSIKYNIVCKAS